MKYNFIIQIFGFINILTISCKLSQSLKRFDFLKQKTGNTLLRIRDFVKLEAHHDTSSVRVKLTGDSLPTLYSAFDLFFNVLVKISGRTTYPRVFVSLSLYADRIYNAETFTM
jgi:hypothetical protein